MTSKRGARSKMGDEAIATGILPRTLANSVSDAIAAAMKLGMEPDEAACIVVAVAADYARCYYGDKYLPHLAKAVTSRAGMAMPFVDDEPTP